MISHSRLNSLLLSMVTLTAAAEDWPGWRGPSYQGISTEKGLPVRWSTTENVAWKTPIAGHGWSSPIVFGDRVFLTATRQDGVKCHVVCLDRTRGNVLWDKEVFEQTPRNKAEKNSYTRALYLANGDILLSGARTLDPKNPWKSRHEDQAELWVLKKDLSGPAVPLGENCSEGPAVSRRTMRIGWTRHNALHMAEVIYQDGKPKLSGRKTVLDAKDLPFKCSLETQNFRPPDEKELTFSAYGYEGTEVMGLNLETGKVVNYSNAPQQYDEPEGVFPDGKHTLVECDRHSRKGAGHIDIYRLALDGSGRLERLTFFNDYAGYKASNPVVSDDGRYMAFQLARSSEAAGIGHGILVFDLQLYDSGKKR